MVGRRRHLQFSEHGAQVAPAQARRLRVLLSSSANREIQPSRTCTQHPHSLPAAVQESPLARGGPDAAAALHSPSLQTTHARMLLYTHGTDTDACWEICAAGTVESSHLYLQSAGRCCGARLCQATTDIQRVLAHAVTRERSSSTHQYGRSPHQCPDSPGPFPDAAFGQSKQAAVIMHSELHIPCALCQMCTNVCQVLVGTACIENHVDFCGGHLGDDRVIDDASILIQHHT
jgi:hypothetical protein